MVDLIDIEKRGANARALGLNELDNPWLSSDHLPDKTGETLEQWRAKHDAWARGFNIESAIIDD